MEGEWRMVEIGSLCEGIYDGPHATPRKTSEGPIFLGVSNLRRGRLVLEGAEHLSDEDFALWTRRVSPQFEDIVFSYETSIGAVAMIPQGLKCCLGRRLALLRVDPSKANSRFLLYAFLAPRFQEELRKRTIRGSTVDRLLLKEFPSFKIWVPQRLQSQKAIAEVLGALDDKIELNRRTSATLEEMSRTLFKNWFVDFEPVRAKAAGRRPAGMDDETAALFPNG